MGKGTREREVKARVGENIHLQTPLSLDPCILEAQVRVYVRRSGCAGGLCSRAANGNIA